MNTEEIAELKAEVIKRCAQVVQSKVNDGQDEGMSVCGFRVNEVPYIGTMTWFKDKHARLQIGLEVSTLDPKETKRYTMQPIKVDGFVRVAGGRKQMPRLNLVASDNFTEALDA
jgi:hypothetical protein